MARLEGTLTKKQRVEIAKDVIALCKSRQRKIRVSPSRYLKVENYFAERELFDQAGRLTSKRLPKCRVCARGAMFVASVDRFDQCDLAKTEVKLLSDLAEYRSEKDWGFSQARLIESAFELHPPMWADRYGGDDPSVLSALRSYIDTLPASPKARLIVLMENIVENKGTFKVPGIEE